jgi:acetyl esterase/lipase
VRYSLANHARLAILWGCLACIGANVVIAQMPASAANPRGGPPIGKDLWGPGFSSPAVKVQYPKNVEAYFDLTYAKVQGYRPLLLDLYRVPGGAPKPAIVFIHGGSFVTGSPRTSFLPVFGEMDGLLAHIASRGYVVVAIAYRLAYEAKWPAQLQDAKTAIRWVRANAAQYGVDPERVAVWGESAGGGVASMVGTTCGVSEFEGEGNLDQSSCVRAAIDWYGVSDMAQLDAQAPANATLIHNSPDSSQSRVLGCVLHYECPASVVAKANPIAYEDSTDSGVSFLIQHGDDDKAVSWKQGQILYDALRAKNVPAKLDIVRGTDHYFVGATREQAQQLLETFFGFLGESLGAPAKK